MKGRRNPNKRAFAHAESALHAANCERRGMVAWTPELIERLRAANSKGGRPAIRAAFPGWRDGQIYSAMRRYCVFKAAVGAPVPLLPKPVVRAKIAAIPPDQFADRFEELLDRRVDCGGAA
jgi:hypothetical protein